MRKTTILVGLLVAILVGTGMASAENWDVDTVITIEATEYKYWDIGVVLENSTLYFEIKGLEDDADITVKIVDEGGSVLHERTGGTITGQFYVSAGVYTEFQVHSNFWFEDQTVDVKIRQDIHYPDNNGNGNGDDDDDNSTPGFGVVPLVATMVVVACVWTRRKR